ncbi:MAG: class I SAM-dependent methyltransferase [Gemmatimonadaceae bacterium]
MPEARLPTIRECYDASPYLSIRHSTYFAVYDELLAGYRERPITFVEIGVLNGGSLFMWRRFLGPQARIIGVDLNPDARRWEGEGFDIAIGDQGDPAFWAGFFTRFSDVDVVLDDGGHTNRQQIVTATACIPHIRDGGVLIVEDVHAAYLREFGNPSRYSFINYAKRHVDWVNARFPALRRQRSAASAAVYAVSFYESIVCLRIDRARCVESEPTSNGGTSLEAPDLRLRSVFAGPVMQRVKWLLGGPLLAPLARVVAPRVARVRLRWESWRLRRWFRRGAIGQP